MDDTTGSANNAGTSGTAIGLLGSDGCYLESGGTTIHYPNHNYVYEAGEALNIYDQDANGTATLNIYEITAATSDDITITPSAGAGGHYVDVNINGPWPSYYPAVYSGTGNIDNNIGLNVAWVLVAAYCHFGSGAGTADFTLTLNAAEGSVYDALIATVEARGNGYDVSLDDGARQGWVFRAGDLINYAWTNPGSIQWGLRVIMRPLSSS